jgi:predicted DCC family thiol-disulfide oxidoreductase YuxK
MGAAHELNGVVVLFDGVCTLCNRTVDFVVRHDRARQFRYGSLQSSAARTLLEKFNLPTDSLESIVVIDRERVYTKSAAALRIARELDKPWRFLTVLRIVPSGLRDRLYDWIARHRYSWFGKKDTCRIPTDAEKELFLE